MANAAWTEPGTAGDVVETWEDNETSPLLDASQPQAARATVEETADHPNGATDDAAPVRDVSEGVLHEATGEAGGIDAELPVAVADEADGEPGAPALEEAGDALDEGGEPPEADTPHASGPDGALMTREEDEVVTPAMLVDTLHAAVTPRRNRRRLAEPAPADQPLGDAQPSREIAMVGPGDALAEPADGAPPTAQLPEASTDDLAWRDQWPDNEVRIVGQLLPRVSEAPPLDGVQRTRMELSLVEQHDGAFGAVGTVPLFVMPSAPGFGPIYREIVWARRRRERLEPITVELEGVLRQMPDRDGRYATERYSVRMGVEVHALRRVAKDSEQFAYWRGRVTVTGFRRYDHRGLPYRRVTGVVARKQRTPHLRGMRVTHIPVDFLVGPEHEHADRFRHVGQRLLVEATISGDVYRMRDDHPDLLGIDDPRRRAQLQVLRESVVTVTLGEFPDAAAEEAYHAWVKAGRPFAGAQTRTPRRSATPSTNVTAAAASADGPGGHDLERAERQNGHWDRRRERREGTADMEHERQGAPSSR